MGVRLTRMSTSAVVLFALVALSLTPAADATCSGTKRNGNTFCAAATCTEAECCEYAPNTCDKYNGQTVGTNVYTCQAGALTTPPMLAVSSRSGPPWPSSRRPAASPQLAHVPCMRAAPIMQPTLLSQPPLVPRMLPAALRTPSARHTPAQRATQ